ncbi:hypothetical protein [Pseudomonas sp. MD195_PC81_125]|uniref:hypothetical protein n=1 Tax=Pseudomonas sp. MD195_PC81_125 TaxID=2741560 RepID=UPI0027411B9A|nr:hypothetical protein [Pseudomonas sp. MD195_PC81_125]
MNHSALHLKAVLDRFVRAEHLTDAQQCLDQTWRQPIANAKPRQPGEFAVEALHLRQITFGELKRVISQILPPSSAIPT